MGVLTCEHIRRVLLGVFYGTQELVGLVVPEADVVPQELHEHELPQVLLLFIPIELLAIKLATNKGELILAAPYLRFLIRALPDFGNEVAQPSHSFCHCKDRILLD